MAHPASFYNAKGKLTEFWHSSKPPPYSVQLMLLRWQEPKEEVCCRRRASKFLHLCYFYYHVKITGLKQVFKTCTYSFTLCSAHLSSLFGDVKLQKLASWLSEFFSSTEEPSVQWCLCPLWPTRAEGQQLVALSTWLWTDRVTSCSSNYTSKPLQTQRSLPQGKAEWVFTGCRLDHAGPRKI